MAGTEVDVIVVGAEIAGLAAARQAAHTGVRVMLVDEQSEPGGRVLGWDGPTAAAAGQWTLDVAAKLAMLRGSTDASSCS